MLRLLAAVIFLVVFPYVQSSLAGLYNLGAFWRDNRNILVFTTQPAGTGSPNTNLTTQPAVSIRTSNNSATVTGATNPVTIGAYTDSNCTTLVSAGVLGANASPVTPASGVATFGGIQYNQTGTIYLGASSTGLVSVCSSAIVISGACAAPALVQNTFNNQGQTGTYTITSSGKGHLLVMAFVVYTQATNSISSITDNAPGGSNSWVAAGTRAISTTTNMSNEIWYAPNSKSGTTTITVNTVTTNGGQGWFMEFTGLGPSAPIVAGTSNAAASTTVTAPTVVTTKACSVVVGVAAVANSITGIKAGNIFTALPISANGNDAAYYRSTATGTYGAQWTQNSNGAYSARTAAFGN